MCGSSESIDKLWTQSNHLISAARLCLRIGGTANSLLHEADGISETDFCLFKNRSLYVSVLEEIYTTTGLSDISKAMYDLYKRVVRYSLPREVFNFDFVAVSFFLTEQFTMFCQPCQYQCGCLDYFYGLNERIVLSSDS